MSQSTASPPSFSLRALQFSLLNMETALTDLRQMEETLQQAQTLDPLEALAAVRTLIQLQAMTAGMLKALLLERAANMGDTQAARILEEIIKAVDEVMDTDEADTKVAETEDGRNEP